MKVKWVRLALNDLWDVVDKAYKLLHSDNRCGPDHLKSETGCCSKYYSVQYKVLRTFPKQALSL